MNNLITTIMAYPFLQHALLAAILASIACGIVGSLVVCNRLTFLAGGASHAAYGGIGLAIYCGFSPLPATLLFTVAASLLMAVMMLRTHKPWQQEGAISADSAIGVLWAAGMAFGIILIELSPGYAGELMGFLFGSILAVSSQDLWIMLTFDAFLLITLGLFHQGLWAISLDSEFAQSRGLPVHALFLLMVGLTALAVVMLIRVVGLILVLALLTIPSAMARQLCSSLYTAMLVACLLSLFFCCSGLALSWYTNISSGAAIITMAATCYFLLALPKLCTQRVRRTS